MNTYVKTFYGHAAIRASRSKVSKMLQVVCGAWVVVPATKTLRQQAATGVIVPTLRTLADGRL